MALKSQSVVLPLTGGLDEASNKEADSAGHRVLENYDHVEGGAIQRRNGFTRVAAFEQRGVRGLVAADNSLAVVSATTYRPYLPGTVGVSGLGGTFSSQHRTITTAWDNKRVRMGDVAVLTASGRTYALLASLTSDEAYNTTWGTTNATTIHYRMVDYATGQTLFAGSVAGHSPRVAVDGAGTKFLLFYMEPGYNTPVNLKVRPIDSATLAASADVTIAADAISSVGRHAIDAFTWDGNAKTYVAYTSATATPNLALARYSFAGGVDATLDDTASAANGQAVAITVNDNSLVVAVYVGTSTHLHASVYPTSLASRTRGTEGGTPVISGTSLTLRSCGVLKVTGSNTVYAVAESFVASDVRVSTYDAAGVGGVTITTAIPQSVLVTKPVEVGGSTSGNFPAVGVTAVNALSSGFRNVLLVSLTGSGNPVAGQVAFDECGVVDAGSGLTSVAPIPYGATSPRKFALAVPVTEEGVDAVASAPQVCRLRVTEVNFGPGVLVTVRNRGLGFVSGSSPRVWDGSRLVQVAFHAPPVTPTGGTGGVSLWSYCLVLEYSDSKGNVQTSPPSGVMTSDATSTTSVVLKYPVIPNDQVTVVRAKLYRTEAGGANFFLARQWVIPYGTVTETVSEGVTDTLLRSAEALYTTGGELESELAPPLVHLCSHKNRLFGPRADDPRTIAYTQELTDPFLPRWHSALTLRVDNEGGDPTAVASLDDKLLVFQKDQIVAVVGDGPDGTGAGSYGIPEIVARGVGVDSDNAAGVVTVPDGVMFRHSSGIFLLTRDLKLVPIGLPVRRTLATTVVTRGRFLPSRHQVWFMLASSQTVLVFDTRFGRWSTYVGPWRVAFDAVEVAGEVYVLDADGNDGVQTTRVYKLDTASYVDYADGSTPTYFSQTAKLPWFRGQRARSQRLWKAGVFGEVVSGTGITMTLDAFSQRPQVNKAKNPETRDVRLTWSSTQLGALQAGGFELWAKAVTQRCSAFRCDITITPSNTDSVGIKLTNLGYLFGFEPSVGKEPTANKPAAS